MKNTFRRIALASALAAGLPAAALDVESYSKDIDACTDFYRYVNAQWLSKTTIPADRASWGVGAEMQKRNEALIRESIAAARSNPPPEGSAQRKAIDFYESGMSLEAIERAGLAPLVSVQATLDEVKDAKSLARALAALHTSGIPAGFDFTVKQDLKDSTHYLFDLTQGGLGLPERDYYFKTDAKTKEQREKYRAHMARMFELAGDKPAAAKANANTAFAIETALARASRTAVDLRDDEKNYNKTTVAKLTSGAPGFPWTEYLNALGAASLANLNNAQPAFSKAFATQVASRPAAQWRTYLRWSALRKLAPMLPKAISDESFAFNQGVINGLKARPEREREVLTIMNGPYGDEPMAQALGQIYVAKAFPPEAKARADALIVNVKAALGDRLREVDWMGDATRQKALAKLAAMNVKIGYPTPWKDYADARIAAAPFAQNWMEAKRFETRRVLKRLGQPVDRSEWWMAPQMVNAYYDPSLNEIVFPAAILQPPMFDATADDAVNYGGIGMVIGHEITHGFDDSGRKYDAQGNLKDWWTADDAKRYDARAQLMVKQFDGYVGVEGLHVNGKLTLGENISDLGGVKIAYLALQKSLAGKPREPVQGFTPEQRFFLAFAESWRRLDRPERERLIIQTDGHSPGRFRVRGPTENLPEFAKAFSCDPAKALRAESERVHIW
ncbi:Neutral endopeptidase [Usitatibacter rugosus]|uniref:Neutral endopeptidase n=1 Tax=Usitatibacter rugosus TaxID=2732067 RepID=A0A6M4GWM0_9PROT|nr:M13 family metallopeptidase [Usitatibacter rugosus]QJR11405.1 Neutral endopeptidase [Usitatibacter rugosus]